jgi:hypothetical protein
VFLLFWLSIFKYAVGMSLLILAALYRKRKHLTPSAPPCSTNQDTDSDGDNQGKTSVDTMMSKAYQAKKAVADLRQLLNSEFVQSFLSDAFTDTTTNGANASTSPCDRVLIDSVHDLDQARIKALRSARSHLFKYDCCFSHCIMLIVRPTHRRCSTAGS